MQVNSISANVNSKASFGHRDADVQRAILEGLANADDRELRHVAAKNAAKTTNDKMHRRMDRALWYSLPLVAGVAAVVQNPSKAVGKLSSRVRLGNLATFAATALSWAGTFAIIDGVFGGARLLEKSSQKVRDFNAEHPMTATFATIGAGIGALMLGRKGLTKILAKGGDKPLSFATKKVFAKLNKALNGSKIINGAEKILAKAPNWAKNFTKGVISWSPMLLVGTSIAHSFNHSRVKTAETVKNYTQLKDAQEQAIGVLAAMDANKDIPDGAIV